MSETVLIVMVKAPLAGTVKTRLIPFLSAQETAELAACFAQDTVFKALTVAENVIIAYSPATGREILEEIFPENILWHEQKGANLGERMHKAIEFAFEKSFSPLIVIGTDSPNLPREFIAKAIAQIKENTADAVLGETTDGGFYLIGLKKPNDEIFRDVEWSSENTFRQTFRNIEKLNLRCFELPVWYDVDFPADLEKLRKDLAENSASAPITARHLIEKEIS